MKKLLSIIVLSLLFSGNAYSDEFKKKGNKDWYVYETTSQRVRIYDTKNAKEIGHQQFKVVMTSSKTKEKLKYQELVVEQLSKFCGKTAGTYPTPKEMLIYGKPDLEDFGIQVEYTNDVHKIYYEIAYKKFVEKRRYDKIKFRERMDFSCSLKEEKLDGSLVQMKLKDILRFEKELVYKEYKSDQYFDCRRELTGRFYRKLEDKVKKIHWTPPREGSLGETFLKEICLRVNI
jgi:hypothetical protein